MNLKLVIANKNYSSWSMRPWVLLTRGRHPLRRGPTQVHRCRRRGGHRAMVAHTAGSSLVDRRSTGLGLACHLRGHGRTLSGETALAGRRCCAPGGPLHQRGDARRLPRAASKHADEHPLVPSRQGPHASGGKRDRARRLDLGNLQVSLRCGRRVAVRRLHLRGRHVRSGREPLQDLLGEITVGGAALRRHRDELGVSEAVVCGCAGGERVRSC